jgi:Domain of unknown function (DUF4157)
MTHLWGYESTEPDRIGCPVPPEAREGLALSVGLDPAPVQRRAAGGLDRTAVRDPVTIDAPKQVEESRATLGVGAAPELSSRQLVRARRANATYHAHLGYDPAVFGGGEPDSAELAEAVAAYQAGHGQVVDGIVGPKTCAAAGTGHGHLASAGRPAPAPGTGVESAAAAEPARRLDRDAVRDPVSIDARPEWEESPSTLDVNGATATATATADAEVQMRAGPAAGDTHADTHTIAAAGVAGSGAPLPYLADIKQSFGRHAGALDSVRVHTGAEAAGAARAIGADAYASGTDIALAASPTRDLVGHEAAHVVQQNASVSLNGGIGAAGDAYEQNADAVAAAVAAGQSAEALLDQVAPAGGAGTGAAGVQRRPDTAQATSAAPSLEDRAAKWVHEKVHHYCDDHGRDDGCFLLPSDRKRLDERIRDHVGIASNNWRDALVDARLAELTKHADGGHAFLEIVFATAAEFVAPGLGHALEFLGNAASSVRAIQAVAPLVNRMDDVEKLFHVATDGIKATVEDATEPTGNAAADFLGRLRQVPSAWAEGIESTFEADLDDWGRLLLYGMTDPDNVLSVPHFHKAIDQLLNRWTSQVDEIGKVAKNPQSPLEHQGMESCVWVMPRAGGEPRLARVHLGDQLVFEDWVDDDMVAMALAQWATVRERVAYGPEMVTIDAFETPPPDAEAWEREAGPHATEDPREPRRAYSHEPPLVTNRRSE